MEKLITLFDVIFSKQIDEGFQYYLMRRISNQASRQCR
jgi:hypothetical protein